jgi:hypothetical protein
MTNVWIHTEIFPGGTEKSFIFLSGEGPRSRRYGRTAALRLLAQPSDEYDYYFLSLS